MSAVDECWIRRLRRDVLEGRLGTDSSDPNACAFASIISQCDVMEMSRAERIGNCAKCTYFGSQSQAFLGRRKIPMPRVFPPASQVSIECNQWSRLMSVTTKERILGFGVLTCVDGIWRNPEGDAGLSKWNCISCVQIAQPDFTPKLEFTLAEVYYIEKRKLQYHFGYFSSGCRDASEDTAAPLRNEKTGQCIYLGTGTTVKYSDACTDRFYFDTGGRIVSAGTRAVALEAYFDTVYSLRSVSLTIGSSFLRPEEVFSINSFGQITNAWLDTQVTNQQLCLEDNTASQSVPSWIRCDGTTSFWAETAWFFDGGDCRFNQLLANLYTPLQWNYVLTNDAYLGSETDSRIETLLESAKTEISSAAFGSCTLTLSSGFKVVSADDLKEIPQQELEFAFGTGSSILEYYSKSFHIGTDTGQTGFKCSIGGQSGPHIRLLAALPRAALVQGAVQASSHDGGSFSAIQAAQVGLVWRTARKLVHLWAGLPDSEFQDCDPWEPGGQAEGGDGVSSGPQAAITGTAATTIKERVLKMSSLVDQMDESELAPATRDQVDGWLSAYVAVMGSAPAEEEEPSEAQLAALHKKVFTLKGPPYADFAIFTPFGRKCLKAQRFRVYQPLGDGSYILRELPGPQNWLQWLSSWRVYKAACLMLGITSLAVLQLYEKHIERLTMMWPRCWGLIYQAEDKARAEHLSKIRRKLLVDAKKNLTMPEDWDENNPWTTCFRMLVADESYWNEQVRHPAAAWTASGCRGSPLAPADQIAMAHVPGGNEVMDIDKEEKVDGKKRQSNRDKRIAKAKRIKADRDELESWRKKGGASEGAKPDKGKGKGKTKDQAGTPICFSFANGSGICGSVEPGGACLQKVKRAHKCQWCLSPGHRNADCPKAPG
eukprot:s1794_g28.t1